MTHLAVCVLEGSVRVMLNQGSPVHCVCRHASVGLYLQINEDLNQTLPQLPLTLEILATNHAGIDVVVAKRHGAQFLKVKVEDRAVNGVKERTTPTQWVLCRLYKYHQTSHSLHARTVLGALIRQVS